MLKARIRVCIGKVGDNKEYEEVAALAASAVHKSP